MNKISKAFTLCLFPSKGGVIFFSLLPVFKSFDYYLFFVYQSVVNFTSIPPHTRIHTNAEQRLVACGCFQF